MGVRKPKAKRRAVMYEDAGSNPALVLMSSYKLKRQAKARAVASDVLRDEGLEAEASWLQGYSKAQVHQVYRCATCPLQSANHCYHPYGRRGAKMHATKPPDWCPLRQGPLELRIAASAT